MFVIHPTVIGVVARNPLSDRNVLSTGLMTGREMQQDVTTDLSLHGRTLVGVANSTDGEVSTDTRFEVKQEGVPLLVGGTPRPEHGSIFGVKSLRVSVTQAPFHADSRVTGGRRDRRTRRSELPQRPHRRPYRAPG
jgi:hypothetical protein